MYSTEMVSEVEAMSGRCRGDVGAMSGREIVKILFLSINLFEIHIRRFVFLFVGIEGICLNIRMLILFGVRFFYLCRDKYRLYSDFRVFVCLHNKDDWDFLLIVL